MLAAPRGVDRERDDVRLVDHQPHPAVGRDLVADAGHEVLGEPVRLELVAVRLGRPRRVEAGALDGVHGRQVVDPHRLDQQPHRGSRDHATSPPSARTPRGSVTYSGTSPARSSASPAARRAAPSASERGAQPGPGRLAPLQGVVRRPTVEVDRDERARLARGPGPRRPGSSSRPARRAGPTIRSDGPAGRSSTAIRRRRGPASSASAVEMPTIGRPSAVGQALRRREPDAQAGERARPGADDDPGQPRAPDVLLAEEPRRSSAGASRRGDSRPARSRRRRSARRPRADRHDDLRRGRVDAPGSRFPAAVVRRRSWHDLEVAPQARRRPPAP